MSKAEIASEFKFDSGAFSNQHSSFSFSKPPASFQNFGEPQQLQRDGSASSTSGQAPFGQTHQNVSDAAKLDGTSKCFKSPSKANCYNVQRPPLSQMQPQTRCSASKFPRAGQDFQGARRVMPFGNDDSKAIRLNQNQNTKAYLQKHFPHFSESEIQAVLTESEQHQSPAKLDSSEKSDAQKQVEQFQQVVNRNFYIDQQLSAQTHTSVVKDYFKNSNKQWEDKMGSSGLPLNSVSPNSEMKSDAASRRKVNKKRTHGAMCAQKQLGETSEGEFSDQTHQVQNVPDQQQQQYKHSQSSSQKYEEKTEEKEENDETLEIEFFKDFETKLATLINDRTAAYHYVAEQLKNYKKAADTQQQMGKNPGLVMYKLCLMKQQLESQLQQTSKENTVLKKGINKMNQRLTVVEQDRHAKMAQVRTLENTVTNHQMWATRPSVPKSDFDEVTRRNSELEQRNSELENELAEFRRLKQIYFQGGMPGNTGSNFQMNSFGGGFGGPSGFGGGGGIC